MLLIKRRLRRRCVSGLMPLSPLSEKDNVMIWSFLAVLFSGWLYVDASYRGPQWQRWVFKPVTLLLLLPGPGKRPRAIPATT